MNGPFEFAALHHAAALVTTTHTDPYAERQALARGAGAVYLHPRLFDAPLDTQAGLDHFYERLPTDLRPIIVFDRIGDLLSVDALIDNGARWWHLVVDPLLDSGFGIVVVEVLPLCGAVPRFGPLAGHEWSRCLSRSRAIGVDLAVSR